MAFSTGTATSHTDLWAKLLAFLTADATLVSSSQQWTVAWSASGATDTVLNGPGGIYIGLSRVDDPVNDSYSLMMRGMAGTLPGATTIGGHVNVSKPVGIYLDTGPMTYWFVASGRRFIVVVKISTVFQALYGGLFLPYTSPDAYPYPLFIGGSRGDNPSSPVNWRNTAVDHSHFVSPTFSTLPTRDSQAWMLDPAGEWRRCWNSGADPGDPKIGLMPEQGFDGMGITQTGSSGYGYDAIRQKMTGAFDTSMPLIPITLVQDVPSDQTYGVLDGAWRVPGIGNSSENIISYGGIDHLVVQNVFRTGTGQYWALALG